jgi:hypothetical protein
VTPDEQFFTGQDLPGGRDSGPDGDGQPPAEDLFSTGRTASPAEVRDSLTASMGLGPNPAPRRPEHPGLRELREGLGL